ncbi:hypothetical protein DAPPUDRAFT_51732, partial [Daphnia pulex]
LLEHCHTKSSKALFAGLCAKLANGTKAGDPLCCYIFGEVGRKVIKLLITHNKIYHIKLVVLFLQDLLGEPNGLPITCVGAVWKSFCLMEGGFLEGVNTQPRPIKSLHSLERFTLLQLQLSLAVGATYIGAKFAKIEFLRDYNSKVFFSKTV